MRRPSQAALVLALSYAVALIVMAAGCGSSEAPETQKQPTFGEQKESTTQYLQEEQITLKNGTLLTCIMDSDHNSLTCDWAHAIKDDGSVPE